MIFLNDILEDLFYGNICGISETGINKSIEYTKLQNNLKTLEENFIECLDQDIKNGFENIKNCYQKLLLLSLKEGYKTGLKTGFNIANEIKNK